MQSETDYTPDKDLEAQSEAYQYFMKVDPNMREFLGPIEEKWDEVTQRNMKQRWAKIAMIRGADPTASQTVYLEPYPHIRQAKGKDLQGWYSAKGDSNFQGQRDRPCETDSILTQPYGGFCTVGCTFSLCTGELIDTTLGPKRIEDITAEDRVWGRTVTGIHSTKVTGYTTHWKAEGYIDLELTNGTVLKLTADHPIYSQDRATWVEAGQLRLGEQLETILVSDVVKVKTITQHPEGVQVYDIETTTGNFYHRGVLVHNCYINSGTRGYRGSGLITVPLGFGNHVGKQLDSMSVSAAGYFSSFIDPFLPIEEYYHNTQQGAQAFIDRGLPIFFLSRVHYPGWAFDQLRQNKYSYAQKSLNTSKQEIWEKISPGAITLQEHFDEIRELRKQGVYVSIQVNPILPGVVDHEDIETLFERLAEVGTNHVIVKFVEAGHAWKGAMAERITAKFPKGGKIFKSLFRENQAGGQCTIIESYRREGHDRYQKKATSLGMTYSLCYEYGKGKDGKWHSIGSEYLTSAQCHGHRVPMFEKKDGLYREMEVCPPSGCLRCADDHDGENLCGSEILVAAKALRLPDLRRPWDSQRKASLTIPLKVV